LHAKLPQLQNSKDQNENGIQAAPKLLSRRQRLFSRVKGLGRSVIAKRPRLSPERKRQVACAAIAVAAFFHPHNNNAAHAGIGLKVSGVRVEATLPSETTAALLAPILPKKTTKAVAAPAAPAASETKSAASKKAKSPKSEAAIRTRNLVLLGGGSLIVLGKVAYDQGKALEEQYSLGVGEIKKKTGSPAPKTNKYIESLDKPKPVSEEDNDKQTVIQEGYMDVLQTSNKIDADEKKEAEEEEKLNKKEDKKSVGPIAKTGPLKTEGT